ncbi:hypothetical protein RRSWK_00382 [Rhodopirellula sp. SWK7]|nr:hypothetical protein RRSWK_00382 [Rhodopirellula sp. SWK7]
MQQGKSANTGLDQSSNATASTRRLIRTTVLQHESFKTETRTD